MQGTGLPTSRKSRKPQPKLPRLDEHKLEKRDNSTLQYLVLAYAQNTLSNDTATIFSIDSSNHLYSADSRYAIQNVPSNFSTVYFDTVNDIQSTGSGNQYLSCVVYNLTTYVLSCSVQGNSIFTYCTDSNNIYGYDFTIGSSTGDCTLINVTASFL